jgi:hypothetical protein
MGYEIWLLKKEKPDQGPEDGGGVVQGGICALTEEKGKRWRESDWLIGELADEADHEHRLSRTGVPFYPEQLTRRTIRFIIVPVCEPYIFRGAKDPLVRIVEQDILALLDPLHVVLGINDA